MTWTEARDLDKTKAALVVPFGAIEQHGPHLSLDTDLFFADRFVDLALERLSEDVNVYRLPIILITKSNEHVGFPRSFWLLAQTLSMMVHDIAESAKISGFRRLVLWNCHGGNRALLEVLAWDVRARTGLMVFQLFPPAIVMDAGPDRRNGEGLWHSRRRLGDQRDAGAFARTRASRPSRSGLSRLQDAQSLARIYRRDRCLADARFSTDRRVGRCDDRHG
jgi:hypothetical protein